MYLSRLNLLDYQHSTSRGTDTPRRSTFGMLSSTVQSLDPSRKEAGTEVKNASQDGFSRGKVFRAKEITSDNEVHSPGTCIGCGVRTHKIKRFSANKPITGANVYKGICIACNPELAPQKALERDESVDETPVSVITITNSSTDSQASFEDSVATYDDDAGPVDEPTKGPGRSTSERIVQYVSSDIVEEKVAFNDISALNAASQAMTEALSTMDALSIHDAVGLLTKTAETATFVKKFFPGAIGSSQVLKQVAPVIERKGFTPENTLFAQSICPDEINHEPEDLPNLFAEYLGEVFHLGGLAGVPFTGKTGFGAFSHHVPESGHLFILMAPHIGVSDDLKLGQYSRLGQTHNGAACGAACGALAHCCANKPLPDLASAHNDYQMSYLMHQINKRKDIILSNEGENGIQAALAYETYDIAKEMLDAIVSLEFGDEHSSLVLLTGIQINMPDPFEDYFQPLSFEMLTKDGQKHDLFDKAF